MHILSTSYLLNLLKILLLAQLRLPSAAPAKLCECLNNSISFLHAFPALWWLLLLLLMVAVVAALLLWLWLLLLCCYGCGCC